MSLNNLFPVTLTGKLHVDWIYKLDLQTNVAFAHFVVYIHSIKIAENVNLNIIK